MFEDYAEKPAPQPRQKSHPKPSGQSHQKSGGNQHYPQPPKDQIAIGQKAYTKCDQILGQLRQQVNSWPPEARPEANEKIAILIKKLRAGDFSSTFKYKFSV